MSTISLDPAKYFALAVAAQERFNSPRELEGEQLETTVSGYLDFVERWGPKSQELCAPHQAIRYSSSGIDVLHRPEFVQEVVKNIQAIRASEGTDGLISLLVEAKQALKTAEPKEFKTKSQNHLFNGEVINTAEFLELIPQMLPFTSLRYLDAELIKTGRSHNVPHYSGFKPKELTQMQKRLLEEPELLTAATEGFLEILNAPELAEFNRTIKEVEAKVIIKTYEGADNKANQIICDGIDRTFSFNQENDLIKTTKAWLGRKLVAKVPLEQKIDYANKINKDLLSIVSPLPNLDLAKERARAKLSELEKQFNLENADIRIAQALYEKLLEEKAQQI